MVKYAWQLLLRSNIQINRNVRSLGLNSIYYAGSQKNIIRALFNLTHPYVLHLVVRSIVGVPSEFMGKTFKAAQLTHEIFLTIDHSCKIFFWYLHNWTSTDLWCVVLYVTYSTTHQRSVEVQFSRYQKNILQEWSMVKNLSCVSCTAWNIFP